MMIKSFKARITQLVEAGVTPHYTFEITFYLIHSSSWHPHPLHTGRSFHLFIQQLACFILRLPCSPLPIASRLPRPNDSLIFINHADTTSGLPDRHCKRPPVTNRQTRNLPCQPERKGLRPEEEQMVASHSLSDPRLIPSISSSIPFSPLYATEHWHTWNEI